MVDHEPGERARLRTRLIDATLPRLVDRALAAQEIIPSLNRVGLNPADLRRTVLAARDEVLVTSRTELERLLDAKLAVAQRPVTHPRRPAMISLGWLLIIAAPAAVAAVWSSLPWWDLVLVITGVLLMVVVGVMGIAAGREFTTAPQPDGSVVSLSLREEERAGRQWEQVLYQDGVLPLVRRLINERLQPLLWTSLTVTSAPGLARVRDSSFMVHTSSATRFLETVRQVSSGAIGLAGPRGVGKSTLIEYYAGRLDKETGSPLRVTVQAPVQYEAREFLLHLYAALCRAVIDRFGGTYDLLSLTRRAADRRIVRYLVIVLVLALTAVVTATVGPQTPLRAMVRLISRVRSGDLNLILAGLLALLGVIVLIRLLWVLLPMSLWPRRRAATRSVLRTAYRHLRRIWFLQTQTAGWSGKLTLPLKAEAGWSHAIQLAERSMTYPEIVDEFRAFLGWATALVQGEPAVVIAVDELDKIESAEDAQHFVNELKGVFGVDRTQFLVAVSEDALASFERRGLSVRDAFDSAFDEIVRIDHLKLADTQLLLNSRVIGVPAPFLCLAHSMSGGLARDVIRVARSMVSMADEDRPPSLDDVCENLVREDIEQKVHAFQRAVGNLSDEVETTDFVRALRSLRPSAPALLETLTDLLPDGGNDHDAALGAFNQLRRQAATYAYHCLTLLEIFTCALDEERTARGRNHPDRGSFDALAEAKQVLAAHPQLARLMLDDFRRAWGLTLA